MGYTWIAGVLSLILTPLAIYGTLGGEGLLAFSIAALMGMFPSLLSVFHLKTLGWVMRAVLAVVGTVIWQADLPLGISEMGLGMTLGLILTPWIIHGFGSTDTAQAGQITFRKKRIQSLLNHFIPEGSWYCIPWPLRIHKLSLADAEKAAAGRAATTPPTASTPSRIWPMVRDNWGILILAGGGLLLLLLGTFLIFGSSYDEEPVVPQIPPHHKFYPPSTNKEPQGQALEKRTKTWTIKEGYELTVPLRNRWKATSTGPVKMTSPSGVVTHLIPESDPIRFQEWKKTLTQKQKDSFLEEGEYSFSPDNGEVVVEIENWWPKKPQGGK